MNAHDLNFWLSAPHWAQLAAADHELLVESTTPEWAKTRNFVVTQNFLNVTHSEKQEISFSADETATLPPGSVVQESHYDPETKRVTPWVTCDVADVTSQKSKNSCAC